MFKRVFLNLIVLIVCALFIAQAVYNLMEVTYTVGAFGMFLALLLITKDIVTRTIVSLATGTLIMLLVTLHNEHEPDIISTEYTIYNTYRYTDGGSNIHLNYDDMKTRRTINYHYDHFDREYMVINNCKPVMVVETSGYSFSKPNTEKWVECGKDIIPYILAHKIKATIVD